MANEKNVEAEGQNVEASKQSQETTPQDDGAVTLDPRAIKILLDAVDVATRRGAFGVQEMGSISNAYIHTNEAIQKIVSQQSQSGNTTNQGDS